MGYRQAEKGRPTGRRLAVKQRKQVAMVEEVRVCRFCGHIDPVDQTGRCQNCGLFAGLAIAPRATAEQLARWRWRSFMRRRLVRLFLVFVLIGGALLWAGRVFFDVGLNPPGATTHLSVHSGPHDWAQVRRTPDNSGFTPDPAPFPHQVTWTYHTAGPLLASPAVVAPHVYLATDDGRILALEQNTGHLAWTSQSGGPSSSTPAVAGDTVICAVRPGRVVALHRQTGAPRWETHLRHAIAASPVVVQGTVYIGAEDRKLYALDAATGQQRWAFATQDWVVSAVASVDDRIILASQNSRMHVIGADTGSQRFVYDTGLGRHIMAAPAIAGNRAYFGSMRGRVWAIDWRATTYPLERVLLFWQTNLYVWGILAQPPVQKGSVWSRRLRGDIKHTPAIAHHTVYVTVSQGKVAALDAETGAERWLAELGVAITAAPTVASATVLVGTLDGRVVGLNAHTGEMQWVFQTAGKITGSPIVAGDTMYVVSHDGTLYALTRAE